MRAARATTLFEIAIALSVLSVAVLSVAALFPAGVRAQQLVRARIHAANVALDLMDGWVGAGQGHPNRQVEADWPSQATIVRRAREDFERALTDASMCPLPPAIAARLDSDGDEIARILADGGCLYYPAASLDVPQSLVVAVRGFPQQDALINHPCLAWPYYDQVPGPPHAWELANWRLDAWPALAEAEALFATFNSDADATVAPDATLAQQYLDHARALVAALATALPMPVTGGGATLLPQPPPPLPPAPWDPADTAVFPHPAWIWAVSHLAHASACATAPQVAGGAPAPDVVAYARAAHDAALAWSHRYRSTDPYDWGMARDATHLCGWDYPLLQDDLFPSATLPAFLSSTVTSDATWRDDVAWRVVARAQPHRYGQARGLRGWNLAIPPDQPAIDASWGDPSHFTLCRAFDACERARELVCFSVDWQAYEDFEEQPAGPQDSSFGLFDSRGVQVGSESYGLVYAERASFFADATRTALADRTQDYAINSWQEADMNRPERKAVILGVFGADRNGNRRYDRGPLPASMRLKAVTVERFVFYDRVVPFSLKG